MGCSLRGCLNGYQERRVHWLLSLAGLHRSQSCDRMTADSATRIEGSWLQIGGDPSKTAVLQLRWRELLKKLAGTRIKRIRNILPRGRGESEPRSFQGGITCLTIAWIP